jgi:hypothetical protein
LGTSPMDKVVKFGGYVFHNHPAVFIAVTLLIL